MRFHCRSGEERQGGRGSGPDDASRHRRHGPRDAETGRSRGARVISPDIQKQLKADPPIAELSPRQKEVLDGIVRGLTNKDIATQLGIRKDGVEKHVKVLLAKIGAANRAEAVAIALRKHLLDNLI